jgi:preprotein translocase subunit SecY
MVKNKINNNSRDVKKQALFVQRLTAFLIDMLLISLIGSFISAPFVNVDKLNELENETFSLINQFQKEEISITDYSSQYMSIYYKLARNHLL